MLPANIKCAILGILLTLMLADTTNITVNVACVKTAKKLKQADQLTTPCNTS